ncbi:MAG: oligosaccharide flippase family protein [Candidatus Hydrogenedens sp.]|nr:oligosaccharide flippase family protein [Candidatus Hydrogenedens sp.]
MSVGRTIARNTVFNGIGRVIEGFGGLALTWYAVRELGAEGWGLWSMVAVFTGYAALLDFGIGSGFTKYVAEHTARGEDAQISQLVSTGLIFYALLGTALVAVLWPLVDACIDGILYLQGAQDEAASAPMEDLRFLFRGGLVLFALNNCIAPFACVPMGLQRMGISNALGVSASAIKIAVAAALIYTGWGVRGLLLGQVASVLFFGAASVVAAFWLVPGLRVGPAQWSRPMFRQLYSFGWRTQVAKLANLVNFQTDRVVIAVVFRFADFTMVGLYGLGEYMAAKMRQVPGLLTSALIPAASALDAQDRPDHLRRLYLVSTKYIGVVSVPLALYFMVCADLVMLGWLGPREDMAAAAWVLRILCLGYLANLLPGPGVSIVLGKGLARVPMWAGIISTTVNVVCTIALYFAVGFYGIPAATSLGMLVSTAWFFLAVRRELGVGLRELLVVSVLWPAVASVPGVAGGLALNAWLAREPDQLWCLLGAGAGLAWFGLSYLVLLRLLPFLDSFDRHFLIHTLRLGRIPGFAFLLGEWGYDHHAR